MTRRNSFPVCLVALTLTAAAVARYVPAPQSAAQTAATNATATSAAAASEFPRTTIDLGVAVSDLDKSLKFYTEAIGFTANPTFHVPGKFCAESGLTDGAPLDIRALTLGADPSATKLKLMQVQGTKKPAAKSANEFVHSQYGFRYLTIFVADMNAALARLEKAGVKPVAHTPIAVPADILPDMHLTIVRDPDGNMVELLGPKK